MRDTVHDDTIAPRGGRMRLAFIVRVEFDGSRWKLTLLDVASGERRHFHSFEGCLTAMREQSEARASRSPQRPGAER